MSVSNLTVNLAENVLGNEGFLGDVGDFNATFTLNLNGTSANYGEVNATAIVQQDWVNKGTGWSIQNEDWHWLNFQVSMPRPSLR